MEFKVGDICDFMGLEVVVEQITFNNMYSIKVNSKEGHYFFTEEGMANVAHTKPSLVLKHKPKKKVKKKVWTNIYNNDYPRTEEMDSQCSQYIPYGGFPSEELAKENAKGAIDYICTVSFEIEVEE
jgi:hypothetical protein